MVVVCTKLLPLVAVGVQILPRQVLGLGRRVVVSVAAAKHHTLVATSAGEVFSFGSNKDGRLGYPAVDTQPTPRK
jgi:alpha-tubulin suppressor-like RCC1 family protein